MSTYRSTSGSPPTSKPVCYRSATDLSHPHSDPFRRCQRCHRTICLDCIGRHVSGGVICVECSGLTFAHTVPVPPAVARRGFGASAGPALRSLGAGVGAVAGGVWQGARWVGNELLRPYRPQPGSRQRLQGDLRVWWITGDTAFQIAIALVVGLAAIVLSALVYGIIREIPFSRVIVAIVGAAVFWAIVASQLLFRFRPLLGDLTARVFAFLLAFVLAFAFGVWLIHWEWLDRVLNLFG